MPKDPSIYSQMTSLRRLDISGHPEFFMCEEKKEALEFEALQGINPDQKKDVHFIDQSFRIDELLRNISPVEELRCDEDLEKHIVERRSQDKFLPHLKMLNGVSIDLSLSSPA